MSWKVVPQHGMSDPEYLRLLEAVGTDGDSWDRALEPYRWFRDSLTVADGVVLYDGRIVVPVGLCGDVLGALHRAHQGSTGMTLRASTMVWWPGVTADIRTWWWLIDILGGLVFHDVGRSQLQS